MTWELLTPALVGLASAVIVAILNNWDKFNKDKKDIKDIKELIHKLGDDVKQTQEDINLLSDRLDTISSAEQALLQTTILEDCRWIQSAIDKGDIDYEEKLKQLIILYREYHYCGFNGQGKLYFNETISKAAEDDNATVRELMNLHFSEYNPDNGRR